MDCDIGHAVAFTQFQADYRFRRTANSTGSWSAMAESLAGNMSLPLSVPSFLSIHMATTDGQMLRWALGFDWSRIAILLSYVVCIFGTFHLAFHGLPKKAARDPGVDNGCPRFLLMFMGLVYASVYFTTDQYVPNLPQMEFDLQGSQTLMSGTVQLNIMVKGPKRPQKLCNKLELRTSLQRECFRAWVKRWSR
eukprot:symbB.v1.2.015704.t1/scaffold1180.1/size133432/13